MLEIQTTTMSGHLMVRFQDLWVSRAPFTNIDWQGNAARLQANHQRYGALIETRVGDEVKHSLHYFSTLATLRDVFGHGRIKEDFGGREVATNDNFTVSVFEFFLLEKLGMKLLKHPVTGVTQFHAQAMCLAIGADLMTEDQFLKIVKGPKGDRRYATPNGESTGPKGEEYVVNFSGRIRDGTRYWTVDVDDPAYPTDPFSGTRHYTGHVQKWMKRNPKETWNFGCLGHPHFASLVWIGDQPIGMNPLRRIHENIPFQIYDGIGFLAAAPA